MQKSSWVVICFILYAVFAVSLTVSADDGGEIFVVSSSFSGDVNYMAVAEADEGVFSPQEILNLGSETGTDYIFMTESRISNGLGDFDNDGDLDYIMAFGSGSGDIYIHEKLIDGNEFADPHPVGSWGEDTWGDGGGSYAMDMAVADFNEDGNVDFVLSLGHTASSGLYIGDGKLGFVYEYESPNTALLYSKLLHNTAAPYSSGADAADFNNDGHADFVIAPGSVPFFHIVPPLAERKFFVNLGDGTGKFTTSSFSSYDGSAARGVAAADFNGDGITDIAAAHPGYIYVYKGIIDEAGGDGINFTYLSRSELPFNLSSIDNYDFDGDGIQDLVVASDDAVSAGVVILLGDGDGTFYYGDTYLGGSEYERNGVTAHPWEPLKNKEPVAVIEPAYLEVAVGDEIVFDGSNSFDEDGEIVSYEWDFGDADPSADVPVIALMSLASVGPEGAGVNPAHTYQESGTYVVTLWVTDDKGSTSSVEAEVAVLAKSLPIIEARAKFSPRKLHLNGKKKGKGKKARYLKARIEFPEGHDARKVDPDRLYLELELDKGLTKVSPVKFKSNFLDKIIKKFSKHKNSITVKFDRQAVLAALECPRAKEITLKVIGEIIHDNKEPEERQKFEATGVIRLKMGKKSSCSAD